MPTCCIDALGKERTNHQMRASPYLKPGYKPYDRRGDKNPKWRGGKTIAPDGRVLIYSPNHPFPNWKNYVYRYRLKIEKKIGRYLKPTEDVHHKNNNPSDDRLSNLELLSHSEHMALHSSITTWSRKHDHCLKCFTTEITHKARGLCTRCYCNMMWPAKLERQRARRKGLK